MIVVRIQSLVLLVLSTLVSLNASAFAAPPSNEIQSLFREGNDAFSRAIERRNESESQANGELLRAINAWNRIIVDHEIENGWLYYNIGNAHLLRDEIGWAILNYRRAQRLIGDEPELVANLNEARRRVKTRVEVASDNRLAEAILFWQGELPPRSQFNLFVFLFVVAWLWALIRLTPAFRSWPRWPGGLVGAAAAVTLGALVWAEYDRNRSPGAVVVESFEGRKGPSETGYERSFLEPIHPGVEVKLVEERGSDWILVRLRDGRTTWAPSRALKTI
ncbi:MAG: hypothetical protein ACF8PN_01630 [Phycisphaerales bacterium]